MWSREERMEKTRIYTKKVENRKKKYMKDKYEKLSRVPEELKEFEHVKIFSKEEYGEIEEAEVEVIVVGDIVVHTTMDIH